MLRVVLISRAVPTSVSRPRGQNLSPAPNGDRHEAAYPCS